MKNIVRYSNHMNEIKFKNFKEKDYDFLMSLCSRLKDQGANTIVLSFSEIKAISGYTSTNKKRFIQDLLGMNNKLLQITSSVISNNTIKQFALFVEFETDICNNTLTVSVNPKWSHLLNNLQANFTRFELEEFVSLDSKYAKTLFRLLKQYRSTGEYRVSVTDLRELMGCPEKYTNYVFYRDILGPSITKVQEFYPTLNCEVQHARTKGNPVSGYVFKFSENPAQLTIDQGINEIRNRSLRKNKPIFNERTYNYAALEKQLLAAQKLKDKESD